MYFAHPANSYLINTPQTKASIQTLICQLNCLLPLPIYLTEELNYGAHSAWTRHKNRFLYYTPGVSYSKELLNVLKSNTVQVLVHCNTPAALGLYQLRPDWSQACVTRFCQHSCADLRHTKISNLFPVYSNLCCGTKSILRYAARSKRSFASF